MECSKCGDESNGSIIVKGGTNFYFCAYCNEKIESAHRNNTHLEDFLSMNKKEWIDRNMKLAKQLRDRGEHIW